MFKENREFWLYFLGVILMFFVVFSMMRAGFEGGNFAFNFFPFTYLNGNTSVLPQSKTNLDLSKNYYAKLITDYGEIDIDLLEKQAPNTVSNFIYLANSGYYTMTRFHRLIKGFILQGGSSTTLNNDPNDDQFGGPGYTISDEINWDSLDYPQSLTSELEKEGYQSNSKVVSEYLGKYSVAMAGNGPNTGGGQFFIVLAENGDPRLLSLQGRHTVFGHVIGGFKTLETINNLPVDNPNSDSPRPHDLKLQQVVIEIKN